MIRFILIAIILSSLFVPSYGYAAWSEATNGCPDLSCEKTDKAINHIDNNDFSSAHNHHPATHTHQQSSATPVSNQDRAKAHSCSLAFCIQIPDLASHDFSPIDYIPPVIFTLNIDFNEFIQTPAPDLLFRPPRQA